MASTLNRGLAGACWARAGGERIGEDARAAGGRELFLTPSAQSRTTSLESCLDPIWQRARMFRAGGHWVRSVQTGARCAAELGAQQQKQGQQHWENISLQQAAWA